MTPADIKALFADHFLREKAFLDALPPATGDSLRLDVRVGRANEFYGRLLTEIEPLKHARPEDVYEALSYFGPAWTIAYISCLSPYNQLQDHIPLFKACLKLEDPERSWDEVNRLAEDEIRRMPFRLDNPHTVISRSFIKTMQEAMQSIVSDKGTTGQIPYIADQLFLGAVLRVDCRLDESKPMRVPGQLLDAAFDLYDRRDGNLSKDQELLICGLVILGSRSLLSNVGTRDDHSRSLRESIEQTRAMFEKMNQEAEGEFERELEEIELLSQRLKGYEHSSLFSDPKKHARRVYGIELSHKAEAAIKSQPGAEHEVRL